MIRTARAPTGDTAFAVAVAAYGQLLRGDANLGDFGFADARALALRGAGTNYLRREFVGLTQLAERQRFASNDGRR
jgi:Ca-activated chloride channel family protein